MKKQSVESQKGEIEFRMKLVEQQVLGKKVFDDEYDRQGTEKLIFDRMEQTQKDMARLKEGGVILSPYIEIGAERAQRGLILENDFGVHGAAVDISLDMLKSCDYYAEAFQREKIPLRVCCDANNMPFMKNSLPFVFCYSVLHHFPDPTPIVSEAYRVLAPGGVFFFDEEPYKKTLYFPLYQRTSIDPNRTKITRILDYFFMQLVGNEEKFGISGDKQMPIPTWKSSLDIFEKKNVTLRSWLKRVESSLFAPDNYPKYLWSYLMGGVIFGTCTKAGTLPNSFKAIEEMLACPTCLEQKREVTLTQQGDKFACGTCNTVYPLEGGVALLFSRSKMAELYPQYVGQMA